jgi:phosphosulfolactate synthase
MKRAKEHSEAFTFIEIMPRSQKPRTHGLTMVLDKGLGLFQAQDLMEAAEFIDIIKLGWTTPRFVAEGTLKRKISLYRKHDIIVGSGGTMLEIICQQGRLDQFFKYCRQIGLELIEVSNGLLAMTPEEKARIIKSAKDAGFQVASEVGRKDPAEDRKLSLQDRVSEARSDLQAGASWVIIEAREGGRSLGVYDDAGVLKQEMARMLASETGIENIMFEAPEKNQQAGLILLFGSQVNLGNIRPEDVIPLETLRRGMRGDTWGKL